MAFFYNAILRYNKPALEVNEMLPRANPLQAFKFRDFRALWLGQFISQIGDNFALIAALVVIRRLSGSALMLGIMAVAMTAPQLVFGLIGGVFVDRFSRKWVMIISDLLRAAAILLLITVKRPEQFIIFPLVGFFMATVGVFFNPARNAIIPNIVSEEMLFTANGLIQASQVAAVILGSALAGLLIAWGGPAPAFIFDSITFLVSALAIASMNIPPVSNSSQAREALLWLQLKEGLSYIKHSKVIQTIMLTAAIATLGLGAIAVLGVVYLEEELGVSPESFGFLNSIQGVGMVIGGLSLGTLSTYIKPSNLVGGGMALLGLAILLFAFAPSFEMALAAAAVIGLCVVTARATLAALLQAFVPDEKRGRVESTVNTAIGMATMLAMGLSGILGDFIGVRTVFSLAGLTTLAAGVIAMLFLKKAYIREVKEQG